MRSILRKAALTLGAAAAVIGLAASNAVADPDFPPLPGDIVGIGSETTQDVLNALARAYNAAHPRPADWLASWDATGTSPIIPKEGCPSIPRTAGINALIADGGTHCIDFVRISRYRSGNAAEANYAFVQFARDGLTYATAVASNVPTTLTTAQLNDVYSRNTGNCVPLFNPYIPQAGSGTRAFFLASIGLSAPGSCVLTSQEHDPSVIVNDPIALAPFSVTRGWGVTGLVLNNIDDSVRPAGLAPNFTATDTPPNGSAASITVYDRGVFNVLRNTDVGVAKYDSVFGPTGWICTSGASIITAQHVRTAAKCGQDTPAQ